MPFSNSLSRQSRAPRKHTKGNRVASGCERFVTDAELIQMLCSVGMSHFAIVRSALQMTQESKLLGMRVQVNLILEVTDSETPHVRSDQNHRYDKRKKPFPKVVDITIQDTLHVYLYNKYKITVTFYVL